MAAAFGRGTDELGNVSRPNQVLVDQFSEQVCDYYQDVASRQIQKMYHEIQELAAGTRPPTPGRTVAESINIRMRQIHTMSTRLTSVNSTLSTVFGRAFRYFLPFIGGVFVLANAEETAEQFLDAARDYALDIQQGNDESGSAAIMSEVCNQMAPGSRLIVLNYLLR